MLRVSIAWCLALSIALSQSSPWESKGTATLNLTQVALKNWVGGGQNTIGIAGLLSYRALYNDARTRWETTLDVGYGLTKLADAPFPQER